MPDRSNKIPPWDRGSPTPEEMYPNDPDHYKRSDYSKFRVDGDWYRCYEPRCPRTHPSLRYIVYAKHFEKYHGHPAPNHREFDHRVLKGSRAEGERLKQVFADWKRAQKAAKLPESPFDKDCNPIPGAAPLIQDFGPGWQNAQLVHPNVPIAPLPAPQPTHQPAAQVPPQTPPPAAPQTAVPPRPVQTENQQARQTVIKHQCYICKKWFSRHSYVPSHMFGQHKTELLREPCQPGRIISAECDRRTKVPIRLVSHGAQQRPQFSLLCEELRELILQKLLAVLTDYGSNKGAIDNKNFKGFAINQATRYHALSVFGKYNFTIRISIAGLDLKAMDAIEDFMSQSLQVLPHAVSEKIGEPALTIELEYDEGPEDRRKHRRNRRTMLSSLIFTERSFPRLCGLIQKDVPRLQALQIRFADWIDDHRHQATKPVIRQYLGYLRGVRNLSWYERGQLVDNNTTQRMCAIRDLEHEVVHDGRELVILLQEQVQRSMIGPARMTLDWLLNVVDIGPMPSEQILGPREGTRFSRLVQNAQRQLYEEVVTIRLELKELSAQNQDPQPATDDGLDHLYRSFNTFVEQQQACMLFPGVTDEVRARMHLAVANRYIRYAYQFLEIYRASGWAPTEVEIQESLNPIDDTEMVGDNGAQADQDDQMTGVERVAGGREGQGQDDEQMTGMEEDHQPEYLRPRLPLHAWSESGQDSEDEDDDDVSSHNIEEDLFQRHPNSLMVELAEAAIREICWTVELADKVDFIDKEELYGRVDSLAESFRHKIDPDRGGDLDHQPLRMLYGPGDLEQHYSLVWRGDPELPSKWRHEGGFDWKNLVDLQKRPEGWEEGKEEIRQRVNVALDEIQAKRMIA